MRFCVHCGRQLRDGEVCPCQQPREDSAGILGKAKRSVSVAFGKEKASGFVTKYWPFLAGALALIVLVVVLCCTLTGGSYQTPLRNVVTILNNQETDVAKIAKRLLPGFILSDVNSIYRDSKDAGSLDDAMDDLEETLQDAYDYLEDYYGRNVTCSYEITDKEKLSNRELKKAQDAIRDLYSDNIADLIDEWDDLDDDEKEDLADYADMSVKEMDSLYQKLEKLGKKLEKARVSKGYELTIDVSMEGKDDEDEYDDLVVRVIKVNGDWILDFTSIGDSSALSLIGDLF